MKLLMSALALTLSLSPSALAQSTPRGARAARATAVDRLDAAVLALDEGRLDDARAAALDALKLDSSPLTAGARCVLFDVALIQGDLDAAATALTELTALKSADPLQLAWQTRAAARLRFERAERRGDLSTARAALSEVKQAQLLMPAEQAWRDRATWRLALRDLEAKADTGAIRRALDSREKQEHLSPEDSAWLALADRRLDLREAELRCDGAARWDGQGLAEDRAWASASATRARVRAASAGGDTSAILASLDALEGGGGALPDETAWATQAGAAARLIDACVAGRRGEVSALQDQVAPFLEAEPSCAWGPARRCDGPPAEGQSWVSLGLRLGGEWATVVQDHSYDELGSTVGLGADGWWALGDRLGVRGALEVDQPYTPGLGRYPVGRAWVGVGWSWPALQVSVGGGLGYEPVWVKITTVTTTTVTTTTVTSTLDTSIEETSEQGSSLPTWSFATLFRPIGGIHFDGLAGSWRYAGTLEVFLKGGGAVASVARPVSKLSFQPWVGPEVSGMWWNAYTGGKLDENDTYSAMDLRIALVAGGRWGGGE